MAFFYPILRTLLYTIEGSTNQKELKPDTIINMLFPLPPLAEQQQIVAKIEELFNLLDNIQNTLI